ncbi:hypothetical protein [Rugamonas sp.]|uniref:hypothetical protein n=1 Tax=Rugamonas sp. TaxID=1926287 RepID=UPI0025FF56AB|nr:hypothetical protein [Rugamonas sp.]
MRNNIIDYLAFAGRHTRSISLVRDLYDNCTIDGYLLTPNSVGAIRQIGEGIALGRAQRAWKIVGPYGSGKSALAIVLAQLFAGPKAHPAALKKLCDISTQTAELFEKSDRLSIPVVGARISFGLALATSIFEAAEQLSKFKLLASFKKQFDFENRTYKGRPFAATAGEMAATFSEIVVMAGQQGLVLFIDEVGKFVEYAALNPEEGDLIALQQVAEASCTANDDKLVVVAMLHQHFASYASGIGRALNDEWHKVAARFEEVPFDEPVERYAHFARHALGTTPDALRVKSLVAESRKVYAHALKRGILRAPSVSDKKLFENAELIYPLHPLTLCSLATVSKRYGQSERSFHAFLNGSEPKGLREFAEHNTLGAWYRVADLYNFLSEGYGLRFRDLGAERRWAFAQAVIERLSLDAPSTLVLKTIAVLELSQSGVFVPITAETISFALGEDDPKAVELTLASLLEQGILVKQRSSAAYAMAVSEAVNIEALYERAARASEGDLAISGISKTLSQRHVVATRHYAETGTIRTMGILVGTADAWPQQPAGKSDEAKPDAWLKIVLVVKGSTSETLALARLNKELDPLSAITCLPVSSEGRAALAELAIWQTVSREVNSKRLDPWTSRYVDGRLQNASETVERLVTSALMPHSEQPGPSYWNSGQLIRGSELMNANQVASWLFKKVYSRAPRIVNELINKEKPASAIVLARQRLFDVILSGEPTRKICGDNEFPPERLIQTTLLRDTGIWQEADGRWELRNPSEDALVDITPVWNEICVQLSAESPRTFSGVLEALAAPPFGVRAGPAGIWVVLYLWVNRARCAVFERGTLVLELTAEHLQRMYKSPNNFTLRALENAEGSKKLIDEYRVALASIGCSVESNTTFLEVARTLYRWFTRLPDYTKQTLQLGKDAALIRSMLNKATDPIQLLTQTLRESHLETKSNLEFSEWLANALTDLGMAHRRLQDNVASELSKGFGISGSLSRVRNQLQAECSKEASRLADAKLRSFILRCTDLLHTDEKWLDSVGSLIVQRPLDSWIDDSMSKFQEGLSDLCGRYKRWMQLVMHRGEAPRAADRFVGLTFTMSGGEEASVFVTTNDTSKSISKDLLSLVLASSKGDPELAAAALAQALVDLQGDAHGVIMKEVENG